MSKQNFKVGQRVYHNYSKIHGTVKEIRSDTGGYNYRIEWDGVHNDDWYHSSALTVDQEYFPPHQPGGYTNTSSAPEPGE